MKISNAGIGATSSFSEFNPRYLISLSFSRISQIVFLTFFLSALRKIYLYLPSISNLGAGYVLHSKYILVLLKHTSAHVVNDLYSSLRELKPFVNHPQWYAQKKSLNSSF